MNQYFGSPLHPGTVEDLIVLLGKHDLDPRLAGHGGCFAVNDHDTDGRPALRFFGNFKDVSWGFDFVTTDDALITRLTAAFKQNRGYQEAVFNHRPR